MVDTIRMFQSYVRNDQAPTHFEATTRETAIKNKGLINGRSYHDKANGYHAYGEDSQLTHHQISLPRLLFGSNGQLIKNQDQIDEALDKLTNLAAQLGKPMSQARRFTRVDLVWQFRADPALWVLAHRQARHPRIRSGAVSHKEGWLSFDGSELRVLIYDKSLKMNRGASNIVRVELQLSGAVLREMLGDGNAVMRLDFNQCYRVYRELLLEFIPKNVPRVGNIAAFLALAEREGWASNGVPAFDLYANGLSERQKRRVRREMAAHRPEAFNMDWRQLLPENGPPEAVDVPRRLVGGTAGQERLARRGRRRRQWHSA